jgi:hypothetical protein
LLQTAQLLLMLLLILLLLVLMLLLILLLMLLYNQYGALPICKATAGQCLKFIHSCLKSKEY